ncbi:zinc-binding dehydrogenase [Nocardia sp. NPDC004860]|uniref:zinc-binding dehydrogenase n=1 Tax=Nocardia sp. NPDC004860 TaxID=3154557 RepID=UPI0033A374E1
MRAALHTGAGAPLTIEKIDLREPGPGEVVVDLEAAAVCVTDVLATEGLTLVPPPFVTGHSGTGTVTVVGPGVTRTRVGDRIVTAGSAECGVCYPCVQGTPSACDDIFGGMVPPRAVATRASGEPVHVDGGVGVFAEQMVLRESGIVTITDALHAEHAALLGCGVLSGLGAVFTVANVRRGSAVAVVGCGHLGLWMVQGARLAGAATIIAVEYDRRRRSLAGELGATHVVDPADGDPIAHVRELTGGRGVDFAFEAGGSTSASEQAFAMARAGGVVVTTSMAQITDLVTLNALDFGVGAKRISSSQSGGGYLKRDIPLFESLLARGDVTAAPIVSATYSLDDINVAFAAARDKEVITGVIRL